MTPPDWERTLRTDPTMAALIDRHGRIEHGPAENGFRRLCVSIINQQLSTASATAVRERVFDSLGEVTPEAVLAADPATLRDAGLSRTKVDYLDNAAAAYRERDLTPTGLADHSNEAVIDELTEIKGVGEWTARMYLMFVLGREDVLPLGDLGIRNGIQEIYGDGDDLTREDMRSIAARWRPYRTYGSRYIWEAYESTE